jgi:hypothetical protein
MGLGKACGNLLGCPGSGQAGWLLLPRTMVASSGVVMCQRLLMEWGPSCTLSAAPTPAVAATRQDRGQLGGRAASQSKQPQH